MIKAIIAAVPLLVSLSSTLPAAEVALDPQLNGAMWVPERGDESVGHGIWILNTATGQVYHCIATSPVPGCMEALMVSTADAAKAAKQLQQKKMP